MFPENSGLLFTHGQPLSHMETSGLDALSLVLGAAVVSSVITSLVLANHRRLRRSRPGSLHVCRGSGSV
jgi:hypothetical protein